MEMRARRSEIMEALGWYVSRLVGMPKEKQCAHGTPTSGFRLSRTSRRSSEFGNVQGFHTAIENAMGLRHSYDVHSSADITPRR